VVEIDLEKEVKEGLISVLKGKPITLDDLIEMAESGEKIYEYNGNEITLDQLIHEKEVNNG